LPSDFVVTEENVPLLRRSVATLAVNREKILDMIEHYPVICEFLDQRFVLRKQDEVDGLISLLRGKIWLHEFRSK
jgi:hypothetical protein